MRKIIIFCLLTAAIAFAQQKQSVAVLPTVAEVSALDPQGQILLTDKVREIAAKTLPINGFILLKQDAIVNRIGEEELYRSCKEGVCVAELTKKISANYGARCDVIKRGDDLALKFELYSVKDEAILETFTDYDVKDFRGMLAVLDARLPDAFRKMIPRGLRIAPLPAIQGGIGNVETAGGVVLEYGERSYVVSVNTDPGGASLSFNGVPVGSCSKTPCKVELLEGEVRILAAMEQYETADTTVSIKQNNQSVNIRLKPNFGVLEIIPAYSESIGNSRPWSVTLNGKAYYSYENRLPPGNYEAKLSHECYEDISVKVGINKGGHWVFETAKYLKLKMGGLILSAEKNGEPVSEPVFANGKKIGETPFNGAVPVCAEIGIGYNNDRVDVEIVHNQTVRYTYRSNGDAAYQGGQNTYEESTSGNSVFEPSTEQALGGREARRTGGGWRMAFGGGVSLMMNSVDTLYKYNGGQGFMSWEWFGKRFDFLRVGLDANIGGIRIKDKEEIKDTVKVNYPNAIGDSIKIESYFGNVIAFVKWYPVDAMYLSGGGGMGWHSASVTGTNISLVTIPATPAFSVGTGLVYKKLLFLDAQYIILPIKGRIAGYLSINAGGGFEFRR